MLAVVWLGARVFAQPLPDRPVFRTGVEIVEVDVVATDADGQPVDDLAPEEFEIFENGKRRELVSFGHVALPLDPPRPSARTDVSTNRFAVDPRVVMLVLDDVNTDRGLTAKVRQAARYLISRLAPHDHVGLLWVSLAKQGAREFTTNHEVVLDAIDAFEGAVRPVERRVGSRTSPLLERPDEAPAVRGATEPLDLKRFFDELRPFKIVADVSRHVASLPQRRKAVVYFGQAAGELGQGPRQANPRDHAHLDLQRAIAAARRANVSVYLLDPRTPLRPGAEGLFEELGVADVRHLAGAGLSGLAAMTGGFQAATPRLEAQVDRILTDISSYYLLGYYADAIPKRGLLGRLRRMASPWSEFREIAVRTSRPGVRIRARRGYWPEAHGTAPAAASARAAVTVDEAVGGLLPRSDLALRGFAAPFKGRGGRHPVALVVEVQDPSLAAAASARAVEGVVLTVMAHEPGGGSRWTHRVEATMSLSAERALALAAGRYLLCASVLLPPGAYQLRVGVKSATAGRVGSVYHDLAVPAFDRSPLALSGLVLSGGREGAALPVARRRTILALSPHMPSLSREFSSDDDVSAFARIYRTRSARQSTVTVATTIESLREAAVVWHDARPVSWRRDEAEHLVALPLRELSPGHYRLTIGVTDGEGRFSAERQVDFRIR